MKNFILFKKVSNVKLIKRAIAGLTAATIMLSTTACNNKNDFERKNDISYSTSTQKEINKWNDYVDETYKLITNNKIVINKDSAETTLLMLNYDGIYNSTSDKREILNDYFKNAKKINAYNDGELTLRLLDAIKTNNTSKDANKNFIKPSTILSDNVLEPDMAVISAFEKDAETLHNYCNGNDKELSNEAALSIFNSVKSYCNNLYEIDGYYFTDLSYSGSIVVENLMQQIITMSENFTNSDERIELETKIKSFNTINRLETEWYSYATKISNNVSSEYVDSDFVLLVNSIDEKRKELHKQISKCVPSTYEQSSDLFAIANIDYFMNNTEVFNYLYPDFDFDKAYSNADNLVESITIYNTIPDANQLSLGDLIIDNNNDKFSIKGIEHFINNINNGDEKEIKNNASFLLRYSNYESDATINVSDNNSGTQVKIGKANISKGATQIINWETLYTIYMSKDKINNEELSNSIINLVDGHDEISNIYNQIKPIYNNIYSDESNKEYTYKYTK